MNIVFCDDNEPILDELIKLVKKIINDYNIYNYQFNYFRYTDPIAVITDLKHINFDIAFLDIEMPQENGLSVGDSIYESNNDAFIFYVTSFEHYLKYSLKHRVYRFIEKGDIAELQDSIKSMLEDLALKRSRYRFEFKKHSYSVPISSIFYFEKSRNNVKIVTDTDIFLQRITIKELVDILPKAFFRCHSGYIVNLSKIKEINDNNVILNNNYVLPVSKKYFFDLLIKFNDTF